MSSPHSRSFEDFLVDAHPALSRYARLISRNRDEADDLLAESLLIAQQRWSSIAEMDFPVAYVRRIVSSRLLKTSTTWFRRFVEVRDPGELPEVADVDAFARLLDREMVAGWLIELPSRQRAAVVLRYFFDLDPTRIGEELGTSANGASTLISRGLSALRSLATASEPRLERPSR